VDSIENLDFSLSSFPRSSQLGLKFARMSKFAAGVDPENFTPPGD
jgi:hypothetical protein